MRRLICILALLVILPASAAEPYLGQLLKQRPFRAAWNELLEADSHIPGWLIQFTRTNNGVDLPTMPVTIAGSTFRLGEVCKPHDCGDNKITVLLKGGGPAWALLRDDGRTRWLGNPDEAVKRVILKGL